MDTKIIELRMAVRALPTSNRNVQLAVKAEVLRLAELLEASATSDDILKSYGRTTKEDEAMHIISAWENDGFDPYFWKKGSI